MAADGAFYTDLTDSPRTSAALDSCVGRLVDHPAGKEEPCGAVPCSTDGAADDRRAGPSQSAELPSTSARVFDAILPVRRREDVAKAEILPALAVGRSAQAVTGTPGQDLKHAGCQPALAEGTEGPVEPKREPSVAAPYHMPNDVEPMTGSVVTPGSGAQETVDTASAARVVPHQTALSCTRCGVAFKRPCELGNHLKSRSCQRRAAPGSQPVADPKTGSRRSTMSRRSSVHSQSLRARDAQPRLRIPNPKYAEDFDTSPSVRAAAQAKTTTSSDNTTASAALKRKREPRTKPAVNAQARPWQPLAGPGTDVAVKQKKKKVATGWLGPRKRPRKINRQPRWQCVNCLTRCPHDAPECPTCLSCKGISLEDICAVEEGARLDTAKLTHHTTVLAYDERMLLHIKGGARDEVSVGECFVNAGVVKTTRTHTATAKQSNAAAATMPVSGDGIQEPSLNAVSAVEKLPESWMQGASSLNITDANSRRDKRKAQPHPERPERIRCMMEYFNILGLMTNVQRIEGREASERELRAVHTERHIASIFKNSDESHDDDMEGCVDTPLAARVAAGTTIETVLAVATGRADNAVAIVRPPGHHAEADSAMGFCCFNNVAIAVRAAQQAKCGVERVLVVDWDVHHGNGTQNIFYDDPSVLTFSIHRRDRSFYPPSGFPDETGKDKGAGFNVNVGWSQKGMGDADYLLAFSRVLVPLAYQFNPDLVIVSAGFDASSGDPLGGCEVTPAGFAHLTALLQGVSRGKLVLVQEGGYNLKQITRCFAACLRVLRGEAPPPLEDRYPKDAAYDDILRTEQALSKFWMGFGYAGINENPEEVEETVAGGTALDDNTAIGKDDAKMASTQPGEGFQSRQPLPNYPPPVIPHGKVDVLLNGRLPPVGSTHHDLAPTW